VQLGIHLRVSLWDGRRRADSISRWDASVQFVAADVKLLCAKHLPKFRLQGGQPMWAGGSDGRIVSAPALPYTERARISCHFTREGARRCKPICCVNQPEEE
jgi:hypothetical protein